MRKSFFLIVITFAITQYSWACDCGKVEHKEEFQRTDLILKGKIISINNDVETCYNGYCNSVYINILIMDIYKGEKTLKKIKLHTANYPSACGFPFEKNNNYLLYLRKVKDSEFYTTSLCTRTTGNKDITEKLIAEIQLINNEIGDEKWPKIRHK